MTSVKARSILCIGAMLALTGCATEDPRKGGLLGGLVGLGSGAYEQRVVDEKVALKAEQARYQETVDSRQRLGRSLEDRKATAAILVAEVASLRRGLDDLDAEIVALQSEKDVTREEVRNAEADVALLLDDIDRVEARQEALEQARALGADGDQDTDPATFGEPPREQVSDLRAYINKLQAAVDALKATREKRASEADPAASDAAD